jgi:cytochrome c-type biogenesis protein CcmH/NrfG
VKIYQQILEADANNLDALYGLGLAYASAGDDAKTKEAGKVWEKFLSKAPASDSRKAIVEEAIKSMGIGLAPPKATPTPKVKK